ncbi:hypothetical protein PHACT_09965 [Pseudohongiella acticola]|uniref:Uncharacterized protein n=1 Tax=Pseudohongiella acticola TaxID=1524254 RepID=A0A1E8CMB0_9GAMM|nr:hypothetical protein PHACT_09965 [Pseudohongiella acticola]
MNIYQAKIRPGPVSSQLDIFSFGGIVSSPRITAYCGGTTVRTIVQTMPDTPTGVQAASPSRVKPKPKTHASPCLQCLKIDRVGQER